MSMNDREKEKKETEEKFGVKGCESRQPLLLIRAHVVSADADGQQFDHHTVRERRGLTVMSPQRKASRFRSTHCNIERRLETPRPRLRKRRDDDCVLIMLGPINYAKAPSTIWLPGAMVARLASIALRDFPPKGCRFESCGGQKNTFAHTLF